MLTYLSSRILSTTRYKEPANYLQLKKKLIKLEKVRSEVRAQQNIEKKVSKKWCYAQNHMTLRRWVTSSWRVLSSWFIYMCDERYILCLNLVSVVTSEMEMKPIVVPDAILHLYQVCYSYSTLTMMTSWSFYMKDKLHQDVICGSNLTKIELFEGFYQDS